MARNNPFTFVDLTGLRPVRTMAGMSWQHNDDNDPGVYQHGRLKEVASEGHARKFGRRDLPDGRNALLRTSFETKMSVWNFARTARS